MYCQLKAVFVTMLMMLPPTQGIQHGSGKCTLLPSELGPDWYKVPQPLPVGYEDLPLSELSFIHMPCAETTVFDVVVCGCTNLMSFIYTSMSKRKEFTKGKALGKVAPRDFVKLVDNEPTTKPPVGSLLINTRTGEVTECPFRASHRGVQWYMTREPEDRWRSMKCAAGTVFDKRQCTCVHGLVPPDSKELDDETIVILEDFSSTKSNDFISQSLGISVSDIDFGSNKNEDIPFWRRQDLFGPNDSKDEKKSFNGKSDVTVTLHNHDAENNTVRGTVDIGNVQISELHRKMFLKDRKEPIARLKPLPLVLDRTLQKQLDLSNDLHSDDERDSLIIDVVKINTKRPDIIPDISKKETKPGKTVLSSEISYLEAPVGTVPAEKVKEEKRKDKNKTNKTETIEGLDAEVIFYNADCRKRPLPELGPQFFLMFVIDLGYIPFSCHGNSVYDVNTCTCTPSRASTKYDELPFPEKDCTKRALPQLGPQFFEDYLHNFGYIPYACHGDTNFNEIKCVCD